MYDFLWGNLPHNQCMHIWKILNRKVDWNTMDAVVGHKKIVNVIKCGYIEKQILK